MCRVVLGNETNEHTRNESCRDGPEDAPGERFREPHEREPECACEEQHAGNDHAVLES